MDTYRVLPGCSVTLRGKTYGEGEFVEMDGFELLANREIGPSLECVSASNTPTPGAYLDRSMRPTQGGGQ